MPATSPTRYRCEFCKSDDANVRFEDDLAICNFCDDVCEKRWVCSLCNERDWHNGCEVCFECLLNEAIRDPKSIEMCSLPLQAEIAKGLAGRLNTQAKAA